MKTKPFLGLAIRQLSLKPGERMSLNEMATWCEAGGEKVSSERLRQIEERALRKIRIFVTRELNNDAKEVLLDGIRLLSQTNVNLWDRTIRRIQ